MGRRTPKFSYWQDAPLTRDQLVLIETTLEDRIPLKHPVRLLDEILDTFDWNSWECKYDGKSGKPPIHPSVLCKVLLYGLSRRIRSSRQMEYAIGHSIDFIWLVSGRSIDHTTLSEFRRKHGGEVKKIYKQLIQLAISMGVAKLSELCIEGTKVQANAGRFKTYKSEGLSKLIKDLDAEITEALAKMETADAVEDLFEDGQPADELPTELHDLQQRRAKLQEALAKLDQMTELRKSDGIDPKKNPAQLPITDEDSRILPNKEGGYAPNYTPIVATETQNGFIIEEDVVIGNVEHVHLFPMVKDIESSYESTTESVLADGAFSTGPNLAEAETRGLELLAPVKAELLKADNPAYRADLSQPVADADLDKLPINPTTKRFDRSAFVYNEEADTYHCPAGKVLTREGTYETHIVAGVEVKRQNYRAHDCCGCPLVALCRVKDATKSGRKISHDEFRKVRERQAQRMQDPEVKKRYNRRQHYGETQFAFIKANMGLRRFLLRGHARVRVEWRWACLSYNLSKLTNLIAGLRASNPLEPSPMS